MIEIKNLTFKYPGFVFENLNLTIGSGEIVAIVGNNASGKTTLLNIIGGINKFKGEILIDGVPLKKSTAKIGVVFQNPDNQIIFNKVYDDIAFTLKNHKIDKKEFDERIDYALKLVEMQDYKNHETFTLSAGQKQRIAIANMLAIKPDIILFDEASVFLDTQTKQLLYHLFLSLKESGVTVVFATNLLEEIVFADKTILLSNGKIMKFDESKKVFEDENLLRSLGIFIPLKIKLINEYGLQNVKFDDELIKALRDKKRK